MPRVEEIFAILEESRVFSKTDANFGFWHTKLKEDTRRYRTFITPFGRFQFCKMSFGSSAAPEFVQKLLTKLLEGLHGVACMRDVILVYGKN